MKKITKLLLPTIALMAMGGQVVNPITNSLNEVHQNEVKKATTTIPQPWSSDVTMSAESTYTITFTDGSFSGDGSSINSAINEKLSSDYQYTAIGDEESGSIDTGISDWSVFPEVAHSPLTYVYGTTSAIISTGIITNYASLQEDTHNSHYSGTITFHIYQYKCTNSVHNGETQQLYYYVPNVPTLQTIIDGISARDLFGIACTVTCTDVERGKYSQAIGVYAVQITATDSYDQTATATLNIHIIDNGKPVIALAAGKNLSFVADSGSLTLANLPSYFTITDTGTSYGGSIGTPSYTYDGSAYSDKNFTSADFGSHTIGVTVADSSGNSQTTNFSLTVTDGTAPVITRRDSSDVSTVIKVGVSRTFSLTKAEFLQIFKATDNVDGDLSSSLAVDGDFIGNKVGTYNVKINCADKSGNTGSITATVQVIADLPPVFILSDTLVQATTAQPLSTADLTSVVTNGILSGKTVTACSVNAGTYIGNENVAGDYTITYEATVSSGTKSVKRANATNDVSGSFILRVTKAAAENTDADTAHWYTPIVEFFQKLGNWFRGVFTKFKFNCFITNTEWDVRYPATEKGSGDSTSSPAVETSSTGEAGK